MAADEFEIIRRYFNRHALAFARPGIALGIGDDCALLTPDPSQQLAVSMDLLQEGVHFLPDADPFLLGQRTLLVNLSDLAAMGAEPLCFTLALTLPAADEEWLERFSAGLAVVAAEHDCPLVGGDLTAAHPQQPLLTVCVQVHGQRPVNVGMLRSGARVGDLIYVTGTLGDAAAGLAVLQQRLGGSGQQRVSPGAQQAHKDAAVQAFFQPESRVRFGMAVRSIANAAIDLSDGLASDLRHILRASAVDAWIDLERLPLSSAFRALIPDGDQPALALGGGDDYELCLTVARARVAQLEEQLRATNTPAVCIGRIGEGAGAVHWRRDGAEVDLDIKGYNHFQDRHRDGSATMGGQH